MEDPVKMSRIGIGLVLGVLGIGIFLLSRKAKVTPLGRTAAPSLLGPSHANLFTPAPAPMPTPASKSPVLLTSNPIPVVTGRTYRAIMGVGFPYSLMANEVAVKQQAEKLGFANVVISKTRPSDFPGTGTGDYYLKATWGAESQGLARPNVPGLSLVEAWEG